MKYNFKYINLLYRDFMNDKRNGSGYARTISSARLFIKKNR